MKKYNWLKIGAYSLAGVVLCGALTYFNFFAPSDGGEDNTDDSAQKCPNFTIDYLFKSENGKMVIDEENTFRYEDHVGDVIVLNFWAQNCEPCKEEIPYFNAMYEKYQDEGLEVLILNTETTKTPQALLDGYVNNPKVASYASYYSVWPTYTCTFGKYTAENDIKKMFTASAFLPVTVIVGRDGYVKYAKDKALTEAELEALIVAELDVTITV